MFGPLTVYLDLLQYIWTLDGMFGPGIICFFQGEGDIRAGNSSFYEIYLYRGRFPLLKMERN